MHANSINIFVQNIKLNGILFLISYFNKKNIVSLSKKISYFPRNFQLLYLFLISTQSRLKPLSFRRMYLQFQNRLHVKWNFLSLLPLYRFSVESHSFSYYLLSPVSFSYAERWRWTESSFSDSVHVGKIDGRLWVRRVRPMYR